MTKICKKKYDAKVLNALSRYRLQQVNEESTENQIKTAEELINLVEKYIKIKE